MHLFLLPSWSKQMIAQNTLLCCFFPCFIFKQLRFHCDYTSFPTSVLLTKVVWRPVGQLAIRSCRCDLSHVAIWRKGEKKTTSPVTSTSCCLKTCLKSRREWVIKKRKRRTGVGTGVAFPWWRQATAREKNKMWYRPGRIYSTPENRLNWCWCLIPTISTTVVTVVSFFSPRLKATFGPNVAPICSFLWSIFSFDWQHLLMVSVAV